MKDIILGLKLLKYGYKLKTNIIMLILFLMYGVSLEIFTHGLQFYGGFCFMITGMFIYQMIMSVDVSEYVQTTTFKKKLQVSIPTVVSTVVYLVIFTFILIERVILVGKYPEDKSMIYFGLYFIIVLILCTHIFSSICYKYFAVGVVIFLILVLGASVAMNMLYMAGLLDGVISAGIIPIAIAGYVVILLGGVLEYKIGLLLYKKPLSEFAFRGIFN